MHLILPEAMVMRPARQHCKVHVRIETYRCQELVFNTSTSSMLVEAQYHKWFTKAGNHNEISLLPFLDNFFFMSLATCHMSYLWSICP